MKEFAKQIANLSKEELVQFLKSCSFHLSERAEQLYDKDPENSGPIAQPFADVAEALLVASSAWDNEEDEQELFVQDPDALGEQKPVSYAPKNSKEKGGWGYRANGWGRKK